MKFCLCVPLCYGADQGIQRLGFTLSAAIEDSVTHLPGQTLKTKHHTKPYF